MSKMAERHAASQQIEAYERMLRVDASIAKQLSQSMAINATLRARIETLEAALEDAINTLRFHVDNPLYNRLTAALGKDVGK
jgi:hypothetical protein